MADLNLPAVGSVHNWNLVDLVEAMNFAEVVAEARGRKVIVKEPIGPEEYREMEVTPNGRMRFGYLKERK